MAATFVQPSPRSMAAVSNGRVPLASNPNAANSPFRGFQPAFGKRTRAQTETTKETVHGQPPSKRQVLDLENLENLHPRGYTRQLHSHRDAEARAVLKRSSAVVTSLDKQLMAAKQSRTAQTHTAAAQAENKVQDVGQWRRHYRKAFPTYTMYLDVSPEAAQRVASQCQTLGARISKFFSRDVTHIVTNKMVAESSESKEKRRAEERAAAASAQEQSRTIDPSLLSAHAGSLRRTADLLDTSIQSRNPKLPQPAENKRDIAQHDLLKKAQDLGVKIWTLEKFERMMHSMFSDASATTTPNHLPRSHATADLANKQSQAELERILRHEKASGHGAREANPVTEWASFRGYYIYVHDMDEILRPIMVRDYPKPNSKDLGKWPQFRQSSAGRCPFVEDPTYARKVAEEEKRAEMAASARTRSRAAMAAPEANTVLVERQANRRESPRRRAGAEVSEHKPLDPPKVPASRQTSAEVAPPMFTSTQAKLRTQTRYIGGEPVASGVQASNVTSAIRSQIISSTAISSTAPGGRIGASKELHALKRKVLERGANVTSGQTLGSSYMNDVRAALNGDNKGRSAKRNAQEALGDIQEDETDARPRKIHHTRAQKAAPLREAKPGYCENCRDKYEDFDEHIISKKHRKFALTKSNWAQLDKLLDQLKRPLKPVPAQTHSRHEVVMPSQAGGPEHHHHHHPERRDSYATY